MDRNTKTYRTLNTGAPNVPQQIPFYSKDIRYMRITNILPVAAAFDLYVEDGNMPGTAINQQFYLAKGLLVPPGVSVVYDTDDLNLSDRLPLYINPSVLDAFSILYRLH
tara:strand:- start:3599 stop:3925 length:327 start_codon:yes stop_codon:yes gene_type:complete